VNFKKGIPFPNAKDPAMNAKKAYNDKYVGQVGKISGNRWYEIQVIFPNLFGFIGFMSI